MGLLDGLIGGAMGAVITNVVGDFVQKQGGLEGLTKQFHEKGLGGMVNSWISTGPNDPVSPDQVRHALGDDTIKDLAAKAGIDPDALLAQLAKALPQAVDKATPQGKLPTA